jgi:hypothetical protein
MNVVKLPPQVSSRRFLSLGAVGWVYKIDDSIALKYPREPGCENFARAIEMFDTFEKNIPCPDISSKREVVSAFSNLSHLVATGTFFSARGLTA